MITKIGLIWVLDQKLLAVFKKTIWKYILPGGKLEEGETETDCLIREIGEELGDIVRKGFEKEIAKGNVRYLDEFGEKIESGEYLNLRCYFAEEIRHDLKDKIMHNSNDNIIAHRWIDGNYESEGLSLASILEYQVLPYLRVRDKVIPYLRPSDPFDCYLGHSWLNPDFFHH